MATRNAAKSTKRIAGLTMALCGAVSIAANAISADHTALGRVVAAWPAIALLLALHLLQHAPKYPLVKIAIVAIAGVAAWASYWHMVHVATMAGEDTVTAHLLPIIVDALMYVATAVFTKPAPVPARRTRTRKPAASKPARKLAAV